MANCQIDKSKQKESIKMQIKNNMAGAINKMLYPIYYFNVLKNKISKKVNIE